jgi:hypothetical protein
MVFSSVQSRKRKRTRPLDEIKNQQLRDLQNQLESLRKEKACIEKKLHASEVALQSVPDLQTKAALQKENKRLQALCSWRLYVQGNHDELLKASKPFQDLVESHETTLKELRLLNSWLQNPTELINRSKPYQKITKKKEELEIEVKALRKQKTEYNPAKQTPVLLPGVGVPVTVCRVHKWVLSNVMSNELTSAIQAQMKTVKEMFSGSFPSRPIIKIEYIMNNELYRQFDSTRNLFRKLGRDTHELLLFHGTQPHNVKT